MAGDVDQVVGSIGSYFQCLLTGSERIWMNSAGDWGCSDPLAVPKARLELSRRGHTSSLIDKVTLNNPQEFLGQSERFKLDSDAE